MLDGRDDIVAVKLLGLASDKCHDMAVGRASGDLSIIAFDGRNRRFKRKTAFDTGGYPLTQMALNKDGLLSVCLSSRDIAVFRTEDDSLEARPLQRIILDEQQPSSRANALLYLRNDRLAVGYSLSDSLEWWIRRCRPTS